LATVIDADRILVMDKGYAQEFDHPFKLMVKEDSDTSITNTEGLFAKMLVATGQETSQNLFEIAKSKYFK